MIIFWGHYNSADNFELIHTRLCATTIDPISIGFLCGDHNGRNLFSQLAKQWIKNIFRFPYLPCVADEIRKDGSVIRDILAQSEIDFIEGTEHRNTCRLHTELILARICRDSVQTPDCIDLSIAVEWI